MKNNKKNKKNKINNNENNTSNDQPTAVVTNPNMQRRPGCTISAGCLWFVILIALTVTSVNECSRSKIRLERDKLKLEQMKKDSAKLATDSMPIITPDTLKIGNHQQVYIPLWKMYQENQKGK